METTNELQGKRTVVTGGTQGIANDSDTGHSASISL